LATWQPGCERIRPACIPHQISGDGGLPVQFGAGVLQRDAGAAFLLQPCRKGATRFIHR
jgi:hypothetical protein